MSAVAQENEYDDEIEMVLAYHKGDARAAIEALLKDRDFLVKEVAIASMLSVTAIPEAGSRRCS
ncbi:hypothetical protein Brsp07_01938 [Brucella sp. NBRC 14130]|nr:hypothetical protein [Brucella intermedia]